MNSVMIALFTDFGLAGPYLGQMTAVLLREAPGVPVVNLFADVPACNPKAAAYLLAAHAAEFPPGTVFLGVVDPGVGGPRRPVIVIADGRTYVGPDNGLFEIVCRRAESSAWWEVIWRPDRLSGSFHGRDLFAPVAARIARGELSTPGTMGDWARPMAGGGTRRPDWPDQLGEIVYIDSFGNAATGLTAASIPVGARVALADGRRLGSARTFSEVPPGEAFWYENANGLLEIAVNRGRADAVLGLSVGAAVAVEAPEKGRLDTTASAL